MRTTVDLPDPLFRQIKMKAVERGMTLKDYFVEALREKITPPVPGKTRMTQPPVRKAGRGAVASMTSADMDALFAREDERKGR